MRIGLVTPELPEARAGNWITAARYRRIFAQLGHRVHLSTSFGGADCDALVALHARRSHPSIRRFRETYPEKPVVVVLTGTDLYRDIRQDRDAQESLDLASRLVVLQRMGVEELAERYRPKTRVIYQSVSACHPGGVRPPSTYFKIAVVGHLRPEKDSLRTALALRLLPAQSRAKAVHVGGVLDEDLGKRAQRENQTNPRYRWSGVVPHWQA